MSGQPFPTGVLFADTARMQPGLKAEVFLHANFDPRKSTVEGTPASNRTEAQVDLQWDEAQPIADIPIKPASVCWTCVMVSPASGEYVLGIVAEGAVPLYVEGKAVIDSWRRDPERPLSTLMNFEAGHAYEMRLEYGQATPKGRIQFGGIAPGQDNSLGKALAAAQAADYVVLTLGYHARSRSRPLLSLPQAALSPLMTRRLAPFSSLGTMASALPMPSQKHFSARSIPPAASPPLSSAVSTKSFSSTPPLLTHPFRCPCANSWVFSECH